MAAIAAITVQDLWGSSSGALYVVRIPGFGGFAGHVQVSGADGVGSRCKVVSWGSFTTDQFVNVRCWHAGGFNLPENAPFILTYVNQQNILGQPVGIHPAGHESAYAWADQPSVAQYPPSSRYLFSTGGAGASATRDGVGVYGMTFTNANLFNGNVQVTGYGSGQEFCNVAYWFDSGVQIRCFNGDGTPVDTRYTVAFTGSYLVGG